MSGPAGTSVSLAGGDAALAKAGEDTSTCPRSLGRGKPLRALADLLLVHSRSRNLQRGKAQMPGSLA